MRAPFWAAIAALALTVAPSVALAQGAGQGVESKFRGPVQPTPPFNTGDVISWNGVAWIASAGPSSGAVPTSRVISTTSPLRIDGGASADLSANRTLSIQPSVTNSYVLATVAGVVSWVNPSSVVTVSLQAAYDGGPNVTIASSAGIALNDATAGGNTVFSVTKNPSGSSGGSGIVVTMGTNATGDGVQVLNLNSGAGGFSFRSRNVGGLTTFSVDNTGSQLTLGGTTSSDVRLMSSAGLGVKLGDNSAYAPMTSATLTLAGGGSSYIDLSDGSSAAVGAAGFGRFRYNDSTHTLQVSLNGAAYVNLATGTPTLQSVCVAGRTYDGTSGAVRLYNANTGSTNALTFNDESAGGVGLKYVSNTGESAGVCLELWTGNTGARASFFALYCKASDGFEVPNGQALLTASLNLNSGSTIVWRDATDVFSGANDLRLRRTAASTLTLDNASASNAVLALIGAQTITRSSADATAGLTVTMGGTSTGHAAYLDKSPSSASAGDALRANLGDNATGNGIGVIATVRTSVPASTQNTGLFVSGGYYVSGMFYGYGMTAQQDSLVRASINISDSKALAQGNGAGICFGGLVDGTTNPFTLAGLQAYKENGTSGDQNGALVIAVRNKDGAGVGNASLVEAGRWTSGKSLQISGQLNAAVSAAGTSALRSNAGTLEVSNNGGSWTAVSTGTSPFTASSTDILTTSASSNVLYLGSAITAPSPVNFTIYGQSGLGANVAGANVTFSSGNSTGNQPSGNTTISTGSPAGTGASGDLTLSTNSSTNGNTGGVVIRSGACGGAGNNSSGSITYQIGGKTGSGTLGHHIFQVNGNNTILEMSSGGASFSVGVAPTTTSLDLGIANTGWKRLYLDYGIDTTAGDAATINHAAGRFRKDTSGTTFTLTNDRITANSIILLTNATDGVGNVYFNCVAGSGSATITFQSGAPSGNCDVNFLVINTD